MYQVITKNDIAMYIAQANATYQEFDNYTEVYTPLPDGSTRTLRVMDLRPADVTIHTGVNIVPSDFVGFKYIYKDGSWSANPDYVPPDEGLPAQ